MSTFDRQQPVNNKSAISAARPVPAAATPPARMARLSRGVSPSRVPLVDAAAGAAHLDVLSADENDGTGGETVDEISRIS